MIGIFIFLLAITAIEAVKVAMDINSSRRCPHDEELRDYLVGRIDKDSPRGEKISRHLGTCTQCQKQITAQ